MLDRLKSTLLENLPYGRHVIRKARHTNERPQDCLASAIMSVHNLQTARCCLKFETNTR